MEADFSGWATKANLKCADGRTILPNAFQHQDQARVPLVWQHGHTDVENVLGHVLLENRPEGVYAYAFFNDTQKAMHAKELIAHKDINMMSIWANQLVQNQKRVSHGAIREVSLVLSGANPGALIENVTIRHSDDTNEELDDEVIVYTGLELEHSSLTLDDDEFDDDDDLEHDDLGPDATLQDVYDSMTDQQKQFVNYAVGAALAEDEAEDAAGIEPGNDNQMIKQDNVGDDDAKKGNGDMGKQSLKHNVFEEDEETGGKGAQHVISHDDMKSIVKAAERCGSLRQAVEQYAEDHLAHGIDDINLLFPEAVAVNATPEFLTRRMEWVGTLLGGLTKSPISRVKTFAADITFEEARAKGYIKGTLKKEEFFSVSRRITTPTTIYKKQKLDRDDIIDITDFDVVAWMKAEMRLMLDEELARAILVGDGRDPASEDKIPETNIRPVATDSELFATRINVNIDDASSSVQEIIDAIVTNRKYYKGTGIPTLFTSETIISMFLLLKDTTGRRLYNSLDEVASELRVSSVVPVEILEDSEYVGIIFNPSDYTVGTTAGGQVSLFDMFDIDYNKMKYLIETRCSGTLTKLKSALVLVKVAGTATLVTPTKPTFDPVTGHLTIVNTAHVVYTNSAGDTVNAAGSPYTVPAGEAETITATPASGYYVPGTKQSIWTFRTNHSA